MPSYAPYYGTYMPNYYQPMQGYPPMNQPMLNQPQSQGANVQQTNNASQPNFFCRPVASKEEALGVPVDFMGSPMFFPDLAHNVVYMKRFNTTTGAADVFEFRGQQEQPSAPAPSFAPLDEFNATKETIGQLKETISQLQSEIDQLKKPTARGKKADVSDE